MKKSLLLVFICFNVFVNFSQKKEFVLKHSLKEKNNYLNQIIPIVNNKTDEFSLFFIEAKKIYGYLLAKNYTVKKTITSDIKSRKYKFFLEKKVFSNDIYSFLMTNSSTNKFGVFNFSYNTNESNFNEIALELKKEKFLKTLIYKDKYYVITTTKKTSIINFYIIDKDGNYKKEVVEFNSEKFTKIFKAELYEKLTYLPNKKIDLANPNSIENTTEFKKMYLIDNELIISFDFNKNFTNTLSINLENLNTEVKQFRKPFLSSETNRKRSNSFIYKDKFYMITATKEKMIFNIKDYHTEELIKEFSVSKDEIISFKNTPVLTKLNRKVFEKKKMKTKSFLKRITNYNIGVSVYEFGDNIQITIGGKSVQNNQATAMGASFGLVGVLLYATLSSTFNNFATYETSSTTYINCVFDTNYNHINGSSKKNAFDKIIDYKTEKRLGIIKNETIFKVNEHYLYGYYNNRRDELHLFKFKDDE